MDFLVADIFRFKYLSVPYDSKDETIEIIFKE